MPSNYEREKENYQYFRTTCGLIGFIVFFLGAFLSFIYAGETGQYYEYTLLFGFAMLLGTSLFFCCVLHESRKIHSSELNEYLLEQEELLQSQSEQQSPLEPQQEPESEPQWLDKTRIDKAYIRQILGLPPRNSNGDTSSENDSDPDMIELQKMAEPGISADSEEPMPGTSEESEDKNTSRFEDADDSQVDSSKEGPSRVSKMSSDTSESKYDIPLKDMSALSLSDSSKCDSNTDEKQADVSAALALLSLNNLEVQDSSIATEYATSEGKSDEEDSQKAENGESNLESKKDA